STSRTEHGSIHGKIPGSLERELPETGEYADFLALEEDAKERVVSTIGKLNIFSEEQIHSAYALFRDFREDLIERLSSGDETELADVLDAWEASILESEDFEQSAYETILKSKLAGLLFVHSEELKDVKLAGEISNAFLHMDFREALEYFLSKNIISPDEWDRLTDAAKDGAFTARRLLAESLRETAATQIQQSIDNNGDLASFIEAVRAEEETLGIAPSDDSYLRTVYETNISVAYNRGKEEALTERIRRRRPYIVRRATIDTRVRDNHKEAHNVAVRSNGPLASLWSRSWGFRCRCSFLTMTEEQVKERGYTIIEEKPDNMGPDKGWVP
ncbi:MAG: phage minor head protein, partial [Coleofasciculus sp. C2-GNP5-27]